MRLLVVGTGLVGTSLALAARAAGHEVALADLDPAHLALARELVGDQPVGDAEPDIVAVAVPPSATAAVMAEALAAHPAATVTDVCSVKAPVLETLAASGADLARVVAGHPMAGRETSGPAAASAELFHGRPWLLTPTAQTDPARLAQVERLVADTGAVARVIAADDHDRAVALTSHTPQVVASLMAARLADADGELIAVAGQGLRDVVRIAQSDPGLWADILTTNADEVVPVLDAVAADLDRVRGSLRAGGTAEVVRVMGAGNEGSARLPAKHGGSPAQYVDVPVEVSDTPGALGRLFLAAGGAGINLEDVRIEHTVGRLTAIAHLHVLPAAAADLRSALAHSGWRVLE